jgi:hypothetical protein
MNEFMHFLPIFTLCEDILLTVATTVATYGLDGTFPLLFITAILLVVDSGLTILDGMTKRWRAHKDGLLPYLSDIRYRNNRIKASCGRVDTYSNCPPRLTRLLLEVEKSAGACLNWDHATMALLVGSTKAKKKARQALLGKEWLSFVSAVPRTERTRIYKAAVSLSQAFRKLEADKLDQHQELVGERPFKVVSATYNRARGSWSYAYQTFAVRSLDT